MKKIFISSSIILTTLFVLAGNTAFAEDKQVQLPPAGLTPESPFYFFDRLGERIQEFFTFNPKAKAKLQIEFAGERIAEIKVMVEEKGTHTEGINAAKSLLLANVAHAAEIINKEKSSGKDVSSLAKDIDDQFDAREKLLVQTFLDARAKLIAEHLDIRTKLLKDAQVSGDTAKISEIQNQLQNIENESNDLKDKKDEIKNSLDEEKKKIEENMNQEDQNQDKIDQNNENQQEQNQEGDQEESELNQAGKQGEQEMEQKGEQGNSELNQENGQEEDQSGSVQNGENGKIENSQNGKQSTQGVNQEGQQVQQGSTENR